MSFAALAEKMKSNNIVVAFDFRGHGGNTTENELMLDEDTLVNDSLEVLLYAHSKYPEHAIQLIGHSMGGSIATKLAAKIETEKANDSIGKALKAVFIIDVVEGTAMEALPFME